MTNFQKKSKKYYNLVIKFTLPKHIPQKTVIKSFSRLHKTTRSKFQLKSDKKQEKKHNSVVSTSDFFILKLDVPSSFSTLSTLKTTKISLGLKAKSHEKNA